MDNKFVDKENIRSIPVDEKRLEQIKKAAANHCDIKKFPDDKPYKGRHLMEELVDSLNYSFIQGALWADAFPFKKEE